MPNYPFIFGARGGGGSGGSVPSVSLAVSDATPYFGQTITLTASPTNITPTSYIFFTYNGATIEVIIEQAGAVYNWTVDRSGTYDVYVLATDGTNNVYALNEITIAIDPDAAAFLLATGITDPVIQGAIEQLVLNLKSFSLWAKMLAIYPFVGGNSSTHKYNLKDPRDLDAAFRLTFSGGLSHSSNGVLPNGSNGYAQTNLFPNTTLTASNWHLSYYSRTNNNLSVDFDFGVGSSFGGYSSSLFLRRSNDTAGFDSGNASSNNRITASSQTNSQGFYIGSIRSNTDRIYIKNGTTTLVSSSSNNSNILMDSQLLIFAYNQVSFGISSVSPDFYGSKQCAFASIGDGLTDIESANFYTAVQAFQTTLGRQV